MPFEDKTHNDVIAGRNAVNEVLRSGREIEFLMIAKGVGGSVMPIIAECRKRKIPIKEMPRQKLDFKLPGVNHQGVAIVVSSGNYSTVEEIIESAKNGEFFGVKSAFGHFSREETATVLVPSVAVCMTVQEFELLFSNNKQLIMKMLRVFSNQLRQIHKKTESVLHNIPEDQQTGMLAVAI